MTSIRRPQPTIALVYDRVNKYGGAEKVLEALHHLYPQAPLYTALYHPPTAPWARDWDIRPSFLNYLSIIRRRHEWLAPLMPYAFESFDFSAFDLVISITSAEAKGIIVKPPTRHLCYLLTPTRYLWHQHSLHVGQGIVKALRLPFLTSLRQWDYLAAQRPDSCVAISQTSASRVEKYYRRPVDAVIYPPVDTAAFALHPRACATSLRDYYLVVSRLVAYKAIEYVIKTFLSRPQETLVIIGSGVDRDRLRALARSAKNIYFIAPVSHSALVCYYHHARALIFPQEEDFGIVAVEAQAAGVPVIAFGQGGATETVIPQKTGLLYPEQSESSLRSALAKCTSTTFSSQRIQQHAQKYDTKVFKTKLQQQVEALCPTSSI